MQRAMLYFPNRGPLDGRTKMAPSPKSSAQSLVSVVSLFLWTLRPTQHESDSFNITKHKVRNALMEPARMNRNLRNACEGLGSTQEHKRLP